MYSNHRTKEQIKDAIRFVRLDLYNAGKKCGAAAIRDQMQEMLIKPLPSESMINRTLDELFLTHQRTGFYEGDYPAWVLREMKSRGIRTSTALRKWLSVHPEAKNLWCVESFSRRREKNDN